MTQTNPLTPFEINEARRIALRWVAARRIIVRQSEPTFTATTNGKVYHNYQSKYMAERRARFVAQGLTTLGQPRKRKPNTPKAK